MYGHIPDRTTKEKGNIWTFGKDSLPEQKEENQSRLQKRNAQRDAELASELSETEREQLKKAGCIRKHIYFSGRVQAVGFRYSALCLAKELQLTGWVKNLTDGRVEAELQGQAELVDSFVERISQRAMRKALRSGEKLQSH